MISKQARAADTDALRLSKLAAMGIEASTSHRFAVRTLRPAPSAPTAIATGSVNSSKPNSEVADAASIPTIQINPDPMLEIRPNCECCDRDLPPESPDAMICTYECTWCRDCADNVLHGVCPNCGGNLERRPIRPAGLLVKDPPSTKRVLRASCP